MTHDLSDRRSNPSRKRSSAHARSITPCSGHDVDAKKNKKKKYTIPTSRPCPSSSTIETPVYPIPSPVYPSSFSTWHVECTRDAYCVSHLTTVPSYFNARLFQLRTILRVPRNAPGTWLRLFNQPPLVFVMASLSAHHLETSSNRCFAVIMRWTQWFYGVLEISNR